MSSLTQDIEDYLIYCEVTKQYSYNTVRNYRQTLHTVLQFMLENNVSESEKIDALAINKLRRHLNQRTTIRKDGMSLRAQAYFIIVLRSFLRYLTKNGRQVVAVDSIELPKARMRKIDYLTESEINRLIAVAIGLRSRRISKVQKVRDRAIILTFFGSGLRLSELLSLRKSQLEGNLDGQLIIEGKGGKVRTTFLAPSAIQAIEEYLVERGRDDNPYIFVTSTMRKDKISKADTDTLDESKKITKILKKAKPPKPLNPKTVQNLVRKYAALAGIEKRITPHTLRHSFATKVLMEGGDLRSVQTLLGHTNISTTQIYTHITDTQIKDLHKRVFKAKPNTEELDPNKVDAVDQNSQEN